jgi:hypothetical protein
MTHRAIHDLPVPILTDEELLAEYDHTFNSAFNGESEGQASTFEMTSVLRRNSATMAELLRRGYRSPGPRWHRSETS